MDVIRMVKLQDYRNETILHRRCGQHNTSIAADKDKIILAPLAVIEHTLTLLVSINPNYTMALT